MLIGGVWGMAKDSRRSLFELDNASLRDRALLDYPEKEMRKK